MNFDFLKNVQVEAPQKATTNRATAPKLPTGLTLRVFASGKVYPSLELVEKYNLQYASKDSSNPGNAFDIFKSSDWSGFPTDAPQTYLFIASVPKDQPKVSIFGSCGYSEDGTPKTSVEEQGGGSFGKELVEIIQDVFGVTIEKGSYVDLGINTDVVIPSNTNVYYIPKVVTRGEKKGQVDAQRRENITINPLYVLQEDISEDEKSEPEMLESFDVDGEEITDLQEVEFEDEENSVVPGFENPTLFV